MNKDLLEAHDDELKAQLRERIESAARREFSIKLANIECLCSSPYKTELEDGLTALKSLQQEYSTR